MTQARKFTPENRLRKLMEAPGGISVQQALHRATGNMESIRGATMAAIDAKIESLAALAAGEEAGRLDSIYRLSNEVFAESGSFGLAELSVVAHNLCSLIAGAEKVPNAALVVHIDAMRLLRKPELAGDASARGAVLAGLRGMNKRLAS
jgi:hypothetical protein